MGKQFRPREGSRKVAEVQASHFARPRRKGRWQRGGHPFRGRFLKNKSGGASNQQHGSTIQEGSHGTDLAAAKGVSAGDATKAPRAIRAIVAAATHFTSRPSAFFHHRASPGALWSPLPRAPWPHPSGADGFIIEARRRHKAPSQKHLHRPHRHCG